MRQKTFDYLIVGAGLFGCTCARLLKDAGKKVLVVERNPYIGGTCHTKLVGGIHVHEHGAHIFRTNDANVYNFLLRFCSFNHFINSPIAIYHDHAYNLPFNMNTFSSIWPVTTPEQAREIIDQEIKEANISYPSNLEEQAINLVGKTIFEMFIKEYSEKQWGMPCKEIDKSVIKRIPLRFTYDNNYYNAKYQGIPIGGYTRMFEKMLKGIEVRTSVDFLTQKETLRCLANTMIFTGPIDEYFSYCFGTLEYRGLEFQEKKMNCTNYQGNAVVNWCDKSVDYTRSIEHKFFDGKALLSPTTIVSFEYPKKWFKGDYPYYPMTNEENLHSYRRYARLASKEINVVFGGRLGNYRYYDMQDTIKAAFSLCRKLLKK